VTPLVEFVPTDELLFCTGSGQDPESGCTHDPVRVVLVGGLWDGNGLCDSEACAARVLAEFDTVNANPWSFYDEDAS
jgi:hypothetical protein